mmetsp:Transcript_119536/g.343392  ORF Transcript_119536/g.343392 Transcript_119536/m.343392 type:complete len:392 (-) Transcript_119536:165-1340(-)
MQEGAKGPEGHPDESVAEWPAPREAAVGQPGGRFVRGDAVDQDGQPGQIYWHDAFGKHTLPDGVNCEECGCDGQNVQTIPQADLDSLPAADTFHCMPMAPAAPTMFPAGRFVVVEEEVAPAAAGGEGAGADGDASVGEDSAAEEPGPVNIDGAAGKKQVYWQSPTGEMHAVPDGYDCGKCGCHNPMRVAAATVKAAPAGKEFSCDMTAGMAVASGVPEIAAYAREAPHFNGNGFNVPAGSLDGDAGDRSQQDLAGAAPSENNPVRWALITLVVLLLAALVFYCAHVLSAKKNGKGRVTRGVGAVFEPCCPGSDQDSSDEEAGNSREFRGLRGSRRGSRRGAGSDGDDGAVGSAGYAYAAASEAPLLQEPAMRSSGLAPQAGGPGGPPPPRR